MSFTYDTTTDTCAEKGRTALKFLRCCVVQNRIDASPRCRPSIPWRKLDDGGFSTMRPTLLLSLSAILVAATAAVTLSSPARADNEYDVSVTKGSITVTAH